MSIDWEDDSFYDDWNSSDSGESSSSEDSGSFWGIDSGNDYNVDSIYNVDSDPFSSYQQSFNPELSGTIFDSSTTAMPAYGRNINSAGLDAGTSSGSVSSYLKDIFSNPATGFALKGIGALFEGNQNKKYADQLKSIASNSALDPFGSQRGYYQNALKSTVTDPYSQPIVKAQIDALTKAQAIKDAQAGRRSNTLTSAPGLIAAQAQIAQNYMNSLHTPSGANISPNGSAIAQALAGSAKADSNGYISPLLNAISNYSKEQSSNSQFEKLLAALKGS